MSLPQIPTIANAFSNLFSVIDALIATARARAEAAAPGSGAHFDDLAAHVAELKSKVNVPDLVAAALLELSQAIKNGSLVVPSATDLSR